MKNHTSSAQNRSPRNYKTVIKPASGWQILNLRELFDYRDLFLSMVWRDIKVLYAQTILGFLWAIIQPLAQIILFTIVFGRVAKVPTEGIPYVLFATTAIIPWTYMSQAMTQSSQSLVAGAGMLDKIYFPRLIFPMTPVLARLIDFILSFIIIIVVAPFYDVIPTMAIVVLPIFYADHDCHRGRYRHVDFGRCDPLQRCAPCHAFCDPNADVYRTGCLFVRIDQ